MSEQPGLFQFIRSGPFLFASGMLSHMLPLLIRLAQVHRSELLTHMIIFRQLNLISPKSSQLQIEFLMNSRVPLE
jgi:hypothetical protein